MFYYGIHNIKILGKKLNFVHKAPLNIKIIHTTYTELTSPFSSISFKKKEYGTDGALALLLRKYSRNPTTLNKISSRVQLEPSLGLSGASLFIRGSSVCVCTYKRKNIEKEQMNLVVCHTMPHIRLVGICVLWLSNAPE